MAGDTRMAHRWHIDGTPPPAQPTYQAIVDAAGQRDDAGLMVDARGIAEHLGIDIATLTAGKPWQRALRAGEVVE